MEVLRGKGFRFVEITPQRVTAPCQPDGEVVTIDESKDGLCKCSLNPEGCLVDGRNIVVQDKYVVVFDN